MITLCSQLFTDLTHYLYVLFSCLLYLEYFVFKHFNFIIVSQINMSKAKTERSFIYLTQVLL